MQWKIRTVRIENARNSDIYAVLSVETVGQGFCNTLPFVVACTRSNWVDMAPAKEGFSNTLPNEAKWH